MRFQPHPFLVPLLLGAVLMLVVAWLIWRRRSGQAEVSFVILMLVEVVWIFAYALELSAGTASGVGAFYRLKSVAVVLVPPLWVAFVISYAHRTIWQHVGRLVLLFAVPVLVILLILTNDLHQLYWRELQVVTQAGGLVMARYHGPAFLLMGAYSVIVGGAALVVLVMLYRQATRLYREQIALLLIAWALPTIAVLVHVLDVPVASNLDVTPFALVLVNLLLAGHMYAIGLFSLSPSTYDKIIDSMEDGVIVLDDQNRIVTINPAASDLIQPLTLDSVGQSIEYVFKGMPELLHRYRDTQSIHTEISLAQPEGTRYFDLSISPLAEGPGSPTGRVIVLRDITMRIDADVQLRTLSRAVEQSGSIIFITDETGRIEYVNPMFTEVTGYTSAEALFQTPRLVRSNQAPSRVYDALWEQLIAGREWRGEFQNRKKNGDLFWVKSVISPVLDASGTITHYVAIQEDITEQKHIMEEEHRQRLLAEALRDNAEAINSTLDLDKMLGHVLENAGRAAFTAYDMASVMLVEGDHVREVRIHYTGTQVDREPEALQSTPLVQMNATRRVVETGEALLIPETRLYDSWIARPGQEWVRAMVLMPIVLDGLVIGVLNLASKVPHAFNGETVTRLRAFTNQAAIAIKNARSFATIQRYSAEMEARNRELDAFSHTVAHDLRSPLALVIGYLTLAQEETDLTLRQNFIDEGVRAAEKMNTMIENMLLLAQIRNAEEIMRQEDLQALAQSAVNRFRVEIEDRGIKVAIAQEFPPVLGYGPWIEEVLANLVSNAIKYIGRDNPTPSITVRAVSYDHVVRCEVQDNGVGIAPEDQAKLFEMFSRFHKGEAKGFGIGLSIVLRIVKKLGGEVGVESELGQGSTFWFTLPVLED